MVNLVQSRTITVIYHFHDAEFDTHLCTLRRAGHVVPMRPKVFQALLYLLQHRERVVRKDELMEAVWDKQFVSDATLESTISTLRRILGDNGRSQRLIQTLSGHGYRFAGTVQEHAHVAESAIGPQHQETQAAPSIPPAKASLPADEAQTPHTVAEQKVVTLLGCSLVFPATALSPDLATMRDLLQRFQAIVQQVVEQYDGLVQPRTGEQLLAVFGARQSQEDHAQRAVLSAFAIRQRLGQQASASMAVQVRIGLHTGLVVVEESTYAADTSVMVLGHAVNQALALQEQAEPDGMLCSESTARLIKHLVRLAVHPPDDALTQAGLPGCYCLGAAPLPPHLTLREERLPGTFVGRTQELRLLQERLTAVEAGYGMVIGMVGEPGIGKSRLLSEFQYILATRPVTYLRGRCVSYGKDLPYLPVLDMLRHYCHIFDTDDSDTVARKLQQALQEVKMEVAIWMPYLRALFDLPGDRDVLHTLSPQVARRRLIETLVQLALRGSQQRPLILAIEDVHWIDSASEEFLLVLSERLARSRLLLLLNYRPGYRSSWMEKSYAMQIALQRFTAIESAQIVHNVVRAAPLASTVLHDIVARAEGNPFFLEELALTVSEAGSTETSAIPLPTTVQAVLAARMDRLGSDDKRLLQMVAVLGKETSLPLLQAAVAWEEAALRAALQRLQRAEFLYEQPARPAPVYTFKHILTQEVAYQTLLRQTRQEYHQRIAQVMEQQFPELVRNQPARLAHHYTAAGLGQAALPYWQQAGQQAQVRSAHLEACQHFQKGIDVLEGLGSTPGHLAQELTLRMQHGTSLILTRGYAAADVEQTFQRAQSLCQEIGDTPQMFSVHWGLWAFSGVRSDLRTSRRHAEHMLALAQQHKASDMLVEAYMALGGAFYWSGAWEQARHHLQRGLDVYDADRHRANTLLYGQDPGVACLGHLSQTLWMLGYAEQARQRAQEGIALARAQAHPYSLAYALIFAATSHQLRREADVTRELAEEAISLSEEHGFAIWLADGHILHGWALTQQGHGAAGIEQLQHGVDAYAATGATLWRTQHLALLAEAYASLGQITAAQRVLAEAQATMQRYHEDYYAAELWRLQGAFLLDTTVPPAALAQASDLLQQARDFARQQGGKSLELRAAMSLARLQQASGASPDAYPALATLLSTFTEGFDTADLQEARALLSM